MAHLRAAVQALAPYHIPHFAERLDMISRHAATLIGVIEHLPEEEVSRAEHTARVMKDYRDMKLGPTIPSHDQNALRWELQRLDKAASS